MGWAKRVAAGTAAGAGIFAVALLDSRLPNEPPIPRGVRLSTAAGTGAVFGLGFGIVRPLLPRHPTTAGAAYGVGCSMALWLLARAIGRAFGDPGADLPLLPLLLKKGSVEKIAEWAALGICIAMAERAARG